ncbi:hypothetical protein NBRC10512_000960 [Rhodotorula toruloides]|uniref:Growth-arrest-specific protein 2 domain containing protein n=1 Tax=Rhodotorula toruloides (strain NP11) TaxID=1130832 RepID=M7XK19_RHOT1|nr:Growth-arrest-specific protein 2 domain containing protein [Rhodotorula toruloides NP11]EMS24204.1 Growth-arrest-specific protein 2 domain containing protein [Rhodotorula toruloides NP11]
MSTALPSTPRAPGRRAKSSALSSNGDELAGEEVLELSLFAEKKVWIEEKIQFLSSLPHVEVTTPEPPARSPVSNEELEAWWAEHDRIEREIQAYDMGDLVKMRNIARERSKQELSPRDTDLIELTLTTLFAVDKLLSLLRQRRKALTLLGYRLKWEEATASAWTSRRRLLADLPTFVAKARWSPTSANESTLAHSASGLLAPKSDLTRSSSSTMLAFSSSSRDLTTLSSSTSSSTLRASTATANLLSLSLSTLTTQSRTLSASAVPLSASFLDKLIDSSTSPLPESFLDEQDRLEDSVKAISEGLHQFAEQLVSQRSAADHLFRRLGAITASARTLEADVLAAQAELPSFTTTADFAPCLVDLERELDDIRADLHDLPRPLHPSAPDQSAHNGELVAFLQQHLRDAKEATRSAETATTQYTADRSAVESARAVRTTLDQLGDELATFQRDVQAIGGRPARLADGLAVLDASETGAEFEQGWDRLAMQVAAALEQTETVQKDAARCVVELADRKICAALRKEVKDAAANLRAQRLGVIEQLDAETKRRDDVSTLRAACRTIDGAERQIGEVEQNLLEFVETTKWREGRMAPIEADDAASVVTMVRTEVNDLFSTSVSPALAFLDRSTLDALRRHLHERSASVIGRINALDELASQVDGLRRQSRSVQAFVERAEATTAELRGTLHELDAVVGGPADGLPGDEEIGTIRARLEVCTADVEVLVVNVATSVPLLAPASPPSSTNGSADLLHLAEQDDHVRAFLNNSCLRILGLVDEARQSANVLAVMQKARTWDGACLEAERTVDALEEDAEDAREVSETSTLTDVLRPDLDCRRTTLLTLDLAPLSVALDDLVDASRRSSVDIDLQTSRRARLEGLRDRSERLAHSARETPRLSLGSQQVPARTDEPANKPTTAQQDSTAATLAFPDEDVALDPFAFETPSDEPAAFSELRRRIERIETAGWLSPSTLVLPPAAEAAVMDGELATCRNELVALAGNSDETLVWADLPSIERYIEDKGKEVRRVAALARFSDFLAKADSTLSDLLNAVDASTPDAPPVTPDPAASPVLPLSDALVAASEAVTAVRVEAIPLADDGRVERAIRRIEDTWSEMLGLVEEIRPRAGSASSSTSAASGTKAAPPPAAHRTPSRPSSQATSIQSTRSSVSRSTSRTSTASSLVSSSTSNGTPGNVAPQTPRPRRPTSDEQTPRLRRSSRLPVRTPRQALSPLPPNASTVPQPFSFDTPVKPRLRQSTRSASRRDSSAASLDKAPVTPRTDRRVSSASSSQGSVRRPNLFSSVAVERPRTEKPSVRSVSTPVVRTLRQTPPRSTQPYRPNVYNKLDREVANVVNSLPNLHVPIEVAEGRWTDESGVYNIGGRLYFCRILRSKQVMVRVGGGWLDLAQFIITHFGVANGLTISPSTSLSANLGSEPQWISSSALRESLSASPSSNSLRDYLATSVSSVGKTDLAQSTTSMSVRRSFPLRPRNSFASSSRGGTTTAPASATATPRANRTPRPPLPVWRP